VLNILTFIRHNAIALAALFVALGGTSYAALSLPAGSVGTAQLRNHSVTPMKLDPSSIGGYVRFWARVSAGGRIIASSPRAKVLVWYKPPSPFSGGQLRWPAQASSDCFAIATVESFPSTGSASAVTVTGRKGFGTQVRIGLSSQLPVNVAVVCPQP
jgi:hypothetical protein